MADGRLCLIFVESMHAYSQSVRHRELPRKLWLSLEVSIWVHGGGGGGV